MPVFLVDEPATTCYRSRRHRGPLHPTIASTAARLPSRFAPHKPQARARAPRTARPLLAHPARRSTTLLMRMRSSVAASPRHAPEPARSPRSCDRRRSRGASPLLRVRTRCALLSTRAHPPPRSAAPPPPHRTPRAASSAHPAECTSPVAGARPHIHRAVSALSLGRWTSESPAQVGRLENNLRRVSSGRARPQARSRSKGPFESRHSPTEAAQHWRARRERALCRSDYKETHSLLVRSATLNKARRAKQAPRRATISANEHANNSAGVRAQRGSAPAARTPPAAAATPTATHNLLSAAQISILA